MGFLYLFIHVTNGKWTQCVACHNSSVDINLRVQFVRSFVRIPLCVLVCVCSLIICGHDTPNYFALVRERVIICIPKIGYWTKSHFLSASFKFGATHSNVVYRKWFQIFAHFFFRKWITYLNLAPNIQIFKCCLQKKNK